MESRRYAVCYQQAADFEVALIADAALLRFMCIDSIVDVRSYLSKPLALGNKSAMSLLSTADNLTAFVHSVPLNNFIH